MLNYLGLEPSVAARAGMDENVPPIRRREVVVEVEAHPGGREQLRWWCVGIMLGVLPPSNVALVVERRQPSPAYQSLGVVLEPLGIRKKLVAHVTVDICLQARHVLSHVLLCFICKVRIRQRACKTRKCHFFVLLPSYSSHLHPFSRFLGTNILILK